MHMLLFYALHRLPRTSLSPYTTLLRSPQTPRRPAPPPAWGDRPPSAVRSTRPCAASDSRTAPTRCGHPARSAAERTRSEKHTSELQSRGHLVCRLLLEKKNI